MDLFEARQEDQVIAGVDEAGRGPLAGPVVAAAVILDPRKPIDELDDSKVLSEKKREQLAERVRVESIAWSIAWSGRDEIDAINILQATMLAMQRALHGLHLTPDLVLVDGNRCPRLRGELTRCRVDAIIGGDGLEPSISAASILAKVARDAEMTRLHQRYPAYGFNVHKGYGTKQHLKKLEQHGPCAIHRRTFSPVRELK